jgi:hypothetical protein
VVSTESADCQRPEKQQPRSDKPGSGQSAESGSGYQFRRRRDHIDSETANLTAGFTLYLINTSGSGAAAVVLDNGGLIGSATTLSIRTNSVRIIQSTGSGTGSAFNILQ